MKKLVVLFGAAVIAASMAMAENKTGTIQWSTGVGLYNHASTSSSFDDYATDGVLANYDVLWQLIHTTDGTTHAPVLANANYLDPLDELLDSRSGNAAAFDTTYSLDVSLYKDQPADLVTSLTLDETTTEYYVYQRVYELTMGTTAPVEGTYYWDSGVENVARDVVDGANQARVYLEYDGQTTWDTPIKANQQVPGAEPAVPEPATMSLLGLGALAMVLRRKLRK